MFECQYKILLFYLYDIGPILFLLLFPKVKEPNVQLDAQLFYHFPLISK